MHPKLHTLTESCLSYVMGIWTLSQVQPWQPHQPCIKPPVRAQIRPARNPLGK